MDLCCAAKSFRFIVSVNPKAINYYNIHMYSIYASTSKDFACSSVKFIISLKRYGKGIVPVQ